MNLVKKLKKDYLDSRKSKNVVLSNLLSVVIGDINKYEIDTKKEVTDDEAIKIIKKVLKGVNDTISYKTSENSLIEKEVLESYLPKQLSEDELRDMLFKLSLPSMKDYMLHFKENYNGMYDGKKLSSMINNKINN